VGCKRSTTKLACERHREPRSISCLQRGTRGRHDASLIDARDRRRTNAQRGCLRGGRRHETRIAGRNGMSVLTSRQCLE
jgi:hypothetical protein